MVDTEDIWKYILMAFLGAIIISPCQLLSLKECKNPGKSKAIINLNTIFLFIMSLLFLKSEKFNIKSLIGIILTSVGVYLII